MKKMNDDMQVVQITETDKTLWNKFVNSATEGNIFQTFKWAHVMKKAGYGQTTCLVMKKNDKIVAEIVLSTRSAIW
jgi:lipid II:glycine glycyltransferase (peptidoglycan interpeptide bridge formation enzyme)